MQGLFRNVNGMIPSWWLHLTGEEWPADGSFRTALDIMGWADPATYKHFSGNLRTTLISMGKAEANPERARLLREQREIDEIDFEEDAAFFSRCTFENFLPRPGFPALAAALQAVQGWVRGKSPYLLTLAGPPGVGKSHLASASLNAMLKDRRYFMFRTEGDILERLHAAIGGGEASVETELKRYMEVPVLILDELGGQAISEWDKAWMDRLIDARWRGVESQKRTLITTNLVGGQLPARMASRLKDVRRGAVVVMNASDYRTGQ